MSMPIRTRNGQARRGCGCPDTKSIIRCAIRNMNSTSNHQGADKTGRKEDVYNGHIGNCGLERAKKSNG
jgi:hypothetical protein